MAALWFNRIVWILATSITIAGVSGGTPVITLLPTAVVEGTPVKAICAISQCASGIGNCTIAFTVPHESGTPVTTSTSLTYSANPTRTDRQCTCTVTDGTTTTTATATITVYYGPEDVKLTGPLKPLKVKSVWPSISCVPVNCSTSCPIAWSGKVVTTKTLNSALGTTVERSQAGTYTCSATNDNSNTVASKSLTITVHYPPDVSVSMSSNGSIMCHPSGIPAIYSYSPWIQTVFGQQVRTINANNGVLTFEQEGYRNMGIYTCRVANNAFPNNIKTGSISKDENDTPVIVSVTNNYNTAKGRHVDINIDVFSNSGSPEVTVSYGNETFEGLFKFTQESIVVPFFNTSINLTYRQGGYSLHWRQQVVNESWFRTYHVQISNTFGEAETSITFTPEGPPDVPSDLKLFSADTHQVQLEVRPGFHGGAKQALVIEYSQNATALTWTVGGNVTMGMDEDPYVRQTITVSGLSPDTLYFFRAYCQNKFSTSESSETLEARTPPTTPVGLILGVVFGVLVSAIIIVVVILLIVRRQRSSQPSSSSNGSTDFKVLDTDNTYVNDNINHSEETQEPFYQNTSFKSEKQAEQTYENHAVSQEEKEQDTKETDERSLDNTLPVEDSYMAMGSSPSSVAQVKPGQYIEFVGDKAEFVQEAYMDVLLPLQTPRKCDTKKVLYYNIPSVDVATEQEQGEADMDFSHVDMDTYENVTDENNEIYINLET